MKAGYPPEPEKRESMRRQGKFRILGATGRLVLATVLGGLPGAMPDGAHAQGIGEALAAKLSESQQRSYVLYLRGRAAFDTELQAYWGAVDQKREGRKKKRAQSAVFSTDDYIAEQPPKYAGPSLPPDVAKIVTEVKPAEPETPKPAVADFLAAARAEYGFIPVTVTEREFKRRYAEESLALSLSKTQVVRIYALETGGRGTFDMQAGIDPETRTGKPISSALGYAQLLSANSISELVKYGEPFAVRLAQLANAPGVPGAKAAALRAKVAALRKMQRVVRAMPNEWSGHVKFGTTPKGYGIHALNLDADIGPWLQAIKLKGLKEEAEKAGRPRLSGAEIELMNLSGPRTGLEMMEPVARGMPTANFFSQGGYYRNTIVREKTAAQLLTALDERMEVSMKKPGAIEFAQVFDEVMRRRGGVER